MIEELFVRWHSPQAIANFLRDYDEINWVSIYRHAYALGLDQIRRRNLRHFFENLLDDAINATPTFAGVLGAARALGCVTEDGRWVEPEKRILMTTVIRKEDASATTTTDPAVSSSEDDAFGATSSSERPESRGSASTPPRAMSRVRRDERQSVPMSSSLLPQAALDSPAAASQASPGSRGVVRPGSREIRLPLNSHKTKAKTISNR